MLHLSLLFNYYIKLLITNWRILDQVACQCLQSAYSLTLEDKHLEVSHPLEDIFKQATLNEPVPTYMSFSSFDGQLEIWEKSPAGSVFDIRIRIQPVKLNYKNPLFKLIFHDFHLIFKNDTIDKFPVY